jgi:hypothetical protein
LPKRKHPLHASSTVSDDHNRNPKQSGDMNTDLVRIEPSAYIECSEAIMAVLPSSRPLLALFHQTKLYQDGESDAAGFTRARISRHWRAGSGTAQGKCGGRRWWKRAGMQGMFPFRQRGDMVDWVEIRIEPSAYIDTGELDLERHRENVGEGAGGKGREADVRMGARP